MKKLLGALVLITILAVGVLTLPAAAPSGSIGNLHIESTWSIDTLTNSENDTLEFSKYLDYPAELTISLHNFELSGTATALYVVEQSATKNSTVNWIRTDTIATSTATGTAVLNLTNRPQLTSDNRLWGYRVRILGINTGTGVHRYNINAIARKLPN